MTTVFEHAAGNETSALLAEASRQLLRSVPGRWEARIEPAVVGGRWFISFVEAGSDHRRVIGVTGDPSTLHDALDALAAGWDTVNSNRGQSARELVA